MAGQERPTLAIGDDSVTYPTMQDVSGASKLFERCSSAGAGDVQEVTLGQSSR